jgi:hypothetical protein
MDLYGSTEALELPPAVKVRIWCHLVLNWLPDATIPQALASLVEVYELNVLHPPTLPAPVVELEDVPVHTARALSIEEMTEELDRVSRPVEQASVPLKHKPDYTQVF